MENILVVGSGGREHAIVWKLSQSDKLETVFVSPGSYGISQIRKAKCVHLGGFKEIVNFCHDNKVKIVFVGPEDPLAQGLADELKDNGIHCFGPVKSGARIEADKSWSKEFMVKYEIPTAKYQSFTDAKLAKEYVANADHEALVIKASGLAAGKGVVVAETKEEAFAAIDEMLINNKFGAASETIVVEEKLSGEEVSVLAFIDGDSIQMMPPAQDHKRLCDGDQGPNTGGMGAYCPCPLVSETELNLIRSHVLERAVLGLKKEGIRYCGVLYAGMMLTKDGPKTLEFNCRFGDPETQVILPLLKSDLYEIVQACCEGQLKNICIEWEKNMTAVGVIMASRGYPETSTKGCKIEGLEIANQSKENLIFHSGVAHTAEAGFVTNGGRVLISIVLNPKLETAAEKATRKCQEDIKFVGAQFRTDIAQKAIKKSIEFVGDKNEFLTKIQPILKATYRKGVLENGLIRLNDVTIHGTTDKYTDPVLVQGVDGVGTKLKIAERMNDYSTIGIDLVAMCVNDVLCVGAEPIAFLDYIACGRLKLDRGMEIVQGIADGCKESRCALIGGETVEMPDIYKSEKYDLGGYCLGLVEHSKIIPRMDLMKEGDILIGLPSSGLHSNGFSLVNKIMSVGKFSFESKAPFSSDNKSFGAEFLTPTTLYVEALLPVLSTGKVNGLAHITGGGLIENIPRALPDHLSAEIDANNFDIPKMFAWIRAQTNLSEYEMLRTFNCGIGMVVILPESNKEAVELLKTKGGKVIGKLVKNSGERVIVHNFEKIIKTMATEFKVTEGLNLTYKTSGVDITAGDDLVQKIKPFAKSTTIPGCIGGLGNFGGLFRLRNETLNIADPVLVLKCKGLGTKLGICQQMGQYKTIGSDLVSICVDKVLSNNAVPLTFLDYYACGKLNVEDASSVIEGMATKCVEYNSVLLGGETAEMPEMYPNKVFDLAGFILGYVEFDQLMPKKGAINDGDLIIGIPFKGLNIEGYGNLKDFQLNLNDVAKFSASKKSIGEELTESIPNTKEVCKLISETDKHIKSVQILSGNGLTKELEKIIPSNAAVEIDCDLFEIPPIYGLIKELLPLNQITKFFNFGIGIVMTISKDHVQTVMDQFLGYNPKVIGKIKTNSSNEKIKFLYLEKKLVHLTKQMTAPRKRVGVLISGSGTNLQTLIDKSRDTSFGMNSDIVVVISNKPNVLGLERAEKAGIKTFCIEHKSFPSREVFDGEISKILEQFQVDIVCLAGYMRIVSEEFVRKWQGKLINIHPSLLPKHRGLNAQKSALESGDQRAGCSIHFVDENVDTGAIILQISVPVVEGDNVESLSARILKAEHSAYSEALKWLANEKVELDLKTKKVIFH